MLNNLIKKKSIYILILIIITITSIYTYKSITNTKTDAEIESYQYYNAIKAIKNNNTKIAKINLKYIIKKNSQYFEPSCLIISKIYSNEKKYKKSQKYLKLITKNKNSKILNIAQINNIKILILEQKNTNAFTYINKIENKKYTCIYEKLKGKIYENIKETQLAKIAYLKSLSNTQNYKFEKKIKKKIKKLNHDQ